MGLLAIMLCILSHAQEVMKIGSYTDVQRWGNKYIDMVLPTTETFEYCGNLFKRACPYRWIYLEARGADGGRRYNPRWFRPDKHHANGGEGAILGGWVKIEDDAQGCIPSGSTIRFIIGQKGKSYTDWDMDLGAGGGGGTGILFLPLNAGNDEWQHLIIAGAGRVAYYERNVGRGHADSDEPAGEAGNSSQIGRAAGWKYGTSGAEPGW
ncbi:MAG: hypothetical protein GY743_22810, partial [Planctomycetaceae bacterium]|nr:hypothetical protein [Planctomycetaceae bacterium]